ncbi:hypothetical protein CVT24_007283 [Panaeolus cyanescens]|uniref:F-box domain-containing protein n=1 Tax=Panaeolus cyanescens TaxID=181874 RepID=A0A409VJ45_9AGAR|nr:hypothetical protein CVT24_007283 [Panaeolus cyanescens]
MFKGLKRRLNGSKKYDSSTESSDNPANLPHLQELERMTPSPNWHGFEQDDIWQNKLPPDIILYIMDEFLQDQESTITAFSSTCRCMYTLCLSRRFNRVTINTRNRDSPTSIERFARMVAKRPQILSFTQRLVLLDQGFMFQGSRPITVEEECLCYILTRCAQYANLRRIDLSFRVVWNLLPLPVKKACLDIFSMPSLKHISFDYMAIPANVLYVLSGISTFEMKGEVRPFSSNELPLPITKSCTTRCTPKKVVLWDKSRTGFIMTNLLDSQTGLCLNDLEEVVILASSQHLTLLEGFLESCGTSLRHMELHSPRGEYELLRYTPLERIC